MCYNLIANMDTEIPPPPIPRIIPSAGPVIRMHYISLAMQYISLASQTYIELQLCWKRGTYVGSFLFSVQLKFDVLLAGEITPCILREVAASSVADPGRGSRVSGHPLEPEYEYN